MHRGFDGFKLNIRADAGLPTKVVVGPRYDALSPSLRNDFLVEFPGLAEQCNPIVRRVVRRTRPMLEEKGLLKPIRVEAHPRHEDATPGVSPDGGLEMSLALRTAYEAAEEFSRLYARRQPGAGFLRTILLRRIGSSAQAGLETARMLLGKLDLGAIPEEEQGEEAGPEQAPPPEAEELELLRVVERNLESVVYGGETDPKVRPISAPPTSGSGRPYPWRLRPWSCRCLKTSRC